MKHLPWGLFSAGLLAGCDQAAPERAPIPPVDVAAPVEIETATFALG